MVTGAFRTSPTKAICCEAGIPPLKYRREQLLLNYVGKIWDLPEHPVYSILFDNNLSEVYENRPTITRPVGIRAKELLNSLGVELHRTLPIGFCEEPPWKINPPECRLDITAFRKEDTNKVLVRHMFYSILNQYPNAVILYTDGSKNEYGVVGSAFTTIGESHLWTLPLASICTAELYAIWQSLRYAETREYNLVIICTDSVSSIQAIQDVFSIEPLVQNMLALLHWLAKIGKRICFVWSPGHIGIEGNEIADHAARQAAEHHDIEDIPMRHSDMKMILCKHIMNRQLEWENEETQLRVIKPSTNKWIIPHKLTRREQVSLTRLRIGHTHLTSFYLLRGERQPRCPTCRNRLTVKHILLDCVQYNHIRQALNIPNSLEECLGNNYAQIKATLDFVKRCNLIYKL